MNVSLGAKWDQFVEEHVKCGDFQSASEVIREGLRLLEKEELLKRISVTSLAELEEKLSQAVESLEKGRKVKAEEVFARLSSRGRMKTRNG